MSAILLPVADFDLQFHVLALKNLLIVGVEDFDNEWRSVSQLCFGLVPRNDNLPIAGVCEPVFLTFPEAWMPIAVARKTSDNVDIPGILRRELGEDLGEMIADTRLPVRLVEPDSGTKWIVRPLTTACESFELAIQEESVTRGLGILYEIPAEPSIGPFTRAEMAGAFRLVLRRVARAHNLSMIAGVLTAERMRRGLGLRIDLELFRKSQAGVSHIPLSRPRIERPQQGDHVICRISNRDSRVVDLMALEIGIFSEYRMQPLPLETNRLEPGRSAELEFPVATFPGNKGEELRSHIRQLIVLAAEARDGDRTEFSWVASESMDEARASFDGPLPLVFNEPFGQLLRYALFVDREEIHGLDIDAVRRHAAQTLQWEIWVR